MGYTTPMTIAPARCAARNLDMPSVSNAQSARQGRNRDNRSRQTHSSQSDRSDYVRLKYP